MKHFLLFFFLFNYFTSSYGQSFGDIWTCGVWPKKTVEKDIDKEIKKGIENKSIVSFVKKKSGDTLIYVIHHTVDGFTLKLLFNLKEYDEEYCNYQQYIFDCTPCSEKHLAEFLKAYRFRKKTENVYISSYSNKTEMTVSHIPVTGCLILDCKNISLKKKEYKALYGSLK